MHKCSIAADVARRENDAGSGAHDDRASRSVRLNACHDAVFEDQLTDWRGDLDIDAKLAQVLVQANDIGLRRRHHLVKALHCMLRLRQRRQEVDANAA